MIYPKDEKELIMLKKSLALYQDIIKDNTHSIGFLDSTCKLLHK